MEDFKILKLLDRVQVLFQKAGVDYPIMRQILQIKLTMDERRVPTLFSQSAKKKEDQKYSYIKSLWIYVLISLVLIPFIGFGQNFLFQMTSTYAIFIFMIMTSMISDFSSVLLDVRDRSILSTKPISAKTVNAAKFMHIFIYLMYLTIALTAIPLIFGLVNQGFLFFAITIVEIVLIDIFIVILTAILYIAILRFFDGEKLKDMINYVQIGLSLFLMIGYQVVIRSFEFVDFDIVIDFHWWSFFLIPMWFAAPYEVLLNGNYSVYTIIFSIFAVIVPIISIWLYIKLIPTFERNMQKLLGLSKAKKPKENRLKEFLLRHICLTNDERAFYRFSSMMMKQEREFKLKVYPSLGFAFILPFIFILTITQGESVDFSVSKTYLFIYFSMLIIPTAVFMLGHSVQYKAGWVYKIFPINDYSDLRKGSLKAFLTKLYVPLFSVQSVVFIFVYGTRIIPDLLAALTVSCLYTAICYKSFGSKLPFSEPIKDMQGAENWKTILLFIPVAVLAGIHYVIIANVNYGSVIYLVVMLIVNFIVWKITFRKRG